MYDLFNSGAGVPPRAWVGVYPDGTLGVGSADSTSAGRQHVDTVAARNETNAPAPFEFDSLFLLPAALRIALGSEEI